MSFILDALKKSESDRQRQSGPGLYEVKVAAPRSPLPYWAIGLIALLGINLVIVAWVLLRRPSHPAEAQAAAVPAPSPSTPAPASPASWTVPAGTASGGAPGATPTYPAAVAGPGGPGGPSSAPVQAPASVPAVGPSGPVSPSEQGDPLRSGGTATAASRGAPQGPADAGTQPQNPDDYAPATEPREPSSLGFHVRQGTEDGVPLYSQVATAPGSGIPELRLDLHAYAPRPQDRFVLINMKRLREGDALPEGVKVETITPDGVILSHNGTRFLLPRE